MLGHPVEREMFSAYVTFVCLGAKERPRPNRAADVEETVVRIIEIG